MEMLLFIDNIDFSLSIYATISWLSIMGNQEKLICSAMKSQQRTKHIGEWSDFLFTRSISAMNSPNLGWYAYGCAK
jgi:hypothetical protein